MVSFCVDLFLCESLICHTRSSTRSWALIWVYERGVSKKNTKYDVEYVLVGTERRISDK